VTAWFSPLIRSLNFVTGELRGRQEEKSALDLIPRFYAACTELGCGLDDQWFESWQRLGIFLFTMAFRPDLGPTQPIQQVTEALSLGVKRPGRETDHLPPSSVEIKECVELYTHSPIRLHGVVLS